MDDRPERRRLKRDIWLAVAAIVFACGEILSLTDGAFTDLGWDPSGLDVAVEVLPILGSLFWLGGWVVVTVAFLGRPHSRDRRLWGSVRVMIIGSLLQLAAAVVVFINVPRDMYHTTWIQDWFALGLRFICAGVVADTLLSVVALVLIARAFNPTAGNVLRRRRLGWAFMAFGLGTVLMVIGLEVGSYHLYFDSLPTTWLAYAAGAFGVAATGVAAWAFLRDAKAVALPWRKRLARRESLLAAAVLIWALGQAVGLGSAIRYRTFLGDSLSVLSTVGTGVMLVASLLVLTAFLVSRRALMRESRGAVAADEVEAQ